MSASTNSLVEDVRKAYASGLEPVAGRFFHGDRCCALGAAYIHGNVREEPVRLPHLVREWAMGKNGASSHDLSAFMEGFDGEEWEGYGSLEFYTAGRDLRKEFIHAQ